MFQSGKISRAEVFIGTKLWNNNHRPERVRPAFEASLRRLHADLYSVHTPYAFKPGDEQDPRDESGKVIYDEAVTLLDTWKAMESLVETRRCKAIGLSDVSLAQLQEIFDAARVKPAVVQVESHPYLPQWELLNFCKGHGIVMQAFAPLRNIMKGMKRPSCSTGSAAPARWWNWWRSFISSIWPGAK